MPAFIPFMLGGLFAAFSAGAVIQGVQNTSQSKQVAASEARRDAAMAAKAPKPAPPPKKPDPPAPPKPAPKPSPPKPSPKSPPKKTPAAEVEAEPETPFSGSSSSTAAAETPAAIKTAPIDTVEFVDETLSAELLLDLLFEDVGGQELLAIARNDTVNGQEVVYQPFKNLGILQEIYNPTSLLKLQETSDKIFSNFTINLLEKIPRVGNGANGANYYLDLVSGDGVIELINMRSDEQVEIQIANAGTIEDIGI
jgi:hypothetical protein